MAQAPSGRRGGHGELGVAAEELDGIGLFGALDEGVMQLLAGRLAVRSVSAGEVIYREAEDGRTMFVVLDGEVELTKVCDGGRARVALRGTHDWFGELSLLDVMPRCVTARAQRSSRLLELRPTDLQAVYRSDVKAYALLVMNLARQLSRKLRAVEARLAAELPPESWAPTNAKDQQGC